MTDALRDPFDLVAEALEIDRAGLGADSRVGVHPQWDSFGHLRVMLALERNYGIAINNETIERYGTMAAIIEAWRTLGDERVDQSAYWGAVVDRFAAKTARDFFRTETRFVSRIHAQVTSVLDIGCAAGRFIELFKQYGSAPAFTGIDIAQPNVDAARKLYPQHQFMVADAVTVDLGQRFDLVNATGVFQHEPRTEGLLANMLHHAARWVLFDVKLADLAAPLNDVARAYCQIGDRRIPFVCLTPIWLRTLLEAQPGIARIEIFGYETPRNSETFVPDEVARWVSAGVFIEKGDGPAEWSVELPDFLG